MSKKAHNEKTTIRMKRTR